MIKKFAPRIAAAAAFATVAGGAVLAIGGAASAETLPSGAHARTAASVVKKAESRSVSLNNPGRDSRGASHDSSRRNDNNKSDSNRKSSDKDVQHRGDQGHKNSNKQHESQNQHGTDNHHKSTHQDPHKKTR